MKKQTEKKEQLKAVIYARYSSDNQREESIEGQIRDCMQYAEYHNISVISTYIDRALSAKTDNRPEFQQMIKDSAKGLFDLVIVWKLDRFARNRYDASHYKNALKENGVKLVSAKETISEGSEGIILESVLEGYAEYYSVDLAEKVSRGMESNAYKCMNNGSVTPMGYYVDEEQHLQLDEKKAPFVKEIFTRFADGESMKEIIADMNARGVGITIKGKRGKIKSREAPLSYNTIRHMLVNRKYLGEYRFNGYVVENAIPAIIDKELFDRAQKRLEINKKAPAAHAAKEAYVLTTKLFCGKCGAMMVGESGVSKSGKLYHYYKCVRARKEHKCDKKAIGKGFIEDVIVNALIQKIMNDKQMKRLSKELYELQLQEDRIVPALKQQLAEVEKKIEAILTAIESGIILKTTKSRLEKLEQEQDRLTLELSEAQLKSPVLTQQQILYGLTRYRNLDFNTLRGKRALIDGFLHKAFLYDGYLVLTCNYKEGNEEISLEDIENSGIPKAFEEQKNKPEQKCSDLLKVGDPSESRTPDTMIKSHVLCHLS